MIYTKHPATLIANFPLTTAPETVIIVVGMGALGVTTLCPFQSQTLERYKNVNVMKPTRLSADEAAIAKAMLARGDRQNDIAAFFGVNPGRISEINTGKAHVAVMPAARDLLPLPGPYLPGMA
ncbi:hypothetical protein [Sphingomonas oligoaromativorans]|uniref:hypothetical protein n=1 Tax=Sphingomonas oligoaromativorans TaxID=575322 RepID=UPI0014205CA6|nr:hypothetical protein [Sphingomonas oligoaromativorans]NIJ35318.1 hypothetical protein [Sphingomonas oligoaromativorans]